MSYRPTRTVSIRVVFFAFPLLFVIGALLPAVYFLYTSAVNNGQTQAHERLILEEARVQTELEHIFSQAQQLNAANARIIELGTLDANSQEALSQYFLAQVKEYQYISSIYFGNTAGGLADAGRDVDPHQLYLIETENFSAGTFTKYEVDENGMRTAVLTTVPDYDARTRGWYQNAAAEQGAAWSDIYTLFTQQDMAIAASHPVYDEDGELLGVLACDIFLGQISTFLADQPISTNGQSLLVDLDGKLIASSAHTVLGSDENAAERLALDTVNAPELNALSLYLRENEIDLHTLDQTTRFSYQSDGERYLVSIAPFTQVAGLNWVSIIMLPEVVFVDALFAESQNLLYVFVLLALLMVVLAIYLSRIVLNPLLFLNREVQRFNLDDTDGVFVHTNFREINDFGAAFNALVQRLKAALSDLYAEIEAHKTSKAQLVWSETLYRSVVEDSPGLLCSFLPNGEITFANKSYAEYYGVAPADMIGENFQDFLHEEDRAGVMREIHSLNKDNPSSSLTQRVRLPSGEVRHQRWVNRALFSEKGELIGYQAFGEDIQQEYQIQQAQSALYRIWRAANRVSDLGDLYPAICEIISEIISTKNFIIALLNEETGLLEPAYFMDENDAPPSASLGQEGPSAYVLKHQKTLHCTPEEFFALQPQLSHDTVYGTAPKIWLGVPLILNGKTIGVMAVQDYDNENAFGLYEQEFLQMISPSVAATIARRRAEDDIQRYAQTNFLLLNASQAISELLDLDLIYKPSTSSSLK